MYDSLINRVMNLLLDGKSEVLNRLKLQYENIEKYKVEDTGVGFYVDFKLSSKAIPIDNNVKQNFVFGDVNGVVNGIVGAVGFILFVRNGYLCTLEGYSNVPGTWPSVNDDIQLVYMDENRNLKELEKNWVI